MKLSPRFTLAAASVAAVATATLTSAALGPAHSQALLLLCALLAIAAAAQSAALERTDLTPALLLSLPPLIGLVAEGSPTWLMPFLAALLLLAGELNALSWECDGVGPVGSVLRRRLREVATLGVLATAASLVVLLASAGPAPRGLLAVVIAALALAALGFVLFSVRTARRAHTNGVAAILALLLTPAAGAAQSQNPSPMVETTRAHERLERTELDGTYRSVTGPGGRQVDIFVPRAFRPAAPATLVIHFHGAAWIPQQAVTGLRSNAVSAVVNLGAGSTTFDRAFSDSRVFTALVDSVVRTVSAVADSDVRVGAVVLTAFSAGHGAIRAILRDSAAFADVGAILLLDGMHTSYVPERQVLAEGGALDTANLVAFAEFARVAIAGRKRLIVTHSEIFPGTFASTTETADWLLHELGLRRRAVLEWGPRGMQQLSAVSSGGFELLGYAGNSAPDHIDHFHALPELLARLLR